MRRVLEITFPLVVLSGVQYATNDVLDDLRVPTNKPLGKEGFCAMAMVYRDYREALSVGLQCEFDDAFLLELDDDDDDDNDDDDDDDDDTAEVKRSKLEEQGVATESVVHVGAQSWIEM